MEYLPDATFIPQQIAVVVAWEDGVQSMQSEEVMAAVFYVAPNILVVLISRISRLADISRSQPTLVIV